MENKKWTTEEDNILIKYYPEQGPSFCGIKLNVSKRMAFRRAKKLGIKMIQEFKNQYSIKYTKESLEEAVKNSFCYADVCRYVGIIPQAGNYGNIRNRIKQYEIDIVHFLTPGELTSLRKKNEKENGINNLEKSVYDYLIYGSKIDSSKLKEKLYREGLKKSECEECSQGEFWRGKKMSLILDHKNGINNDNQLENLRILCPNCNATLDTHCSKNRKIKTKEIKLTL
jgi:5-methylcytosine-specific restriction endonuclease McrA